MVEDASVVAQGCQSEFERLHLELVSGDVVLERHSLLLLRLDVGDELAGQGDVLLVHLDLIVNLVEVQILPQGDEAHLLSGEFHAHLSLLLAQFGEADSGVDGSTCIDHLLGLQGEVVAEVRGAQTVYVGEVTVGEQGVADVTEGEGGIDVGQFLALSRLDAEIGGLHARFHGAKTLVVILNLGEELVDGHRLLPPNCASRKQEAYE